MGIPHHGWLVPQPIPNRWTRYSQEVKDWLEGLDPRKIAERLLVDQFTVIYSLCSLLITDTWFVLKNEVWWKEKVNGFSRTLLPLGWVFSSGIHS